MTMKGYSSDIPENCARARLEDVNASYKDLAQVCGVIRNKKTDWAVGFLEKAAEGTIPVRYRKHNTRLGHRRELGGKKGRYPVKAARIVLKVLKSAMSNGKVTGLGESFTVLSATANKKRIYPRIAPKGRWSRSFLETSRVEIILQGSEVPAGVEVTPPKKEAIPKKEATKKEEAPAKEIPKKEAKPEPKPALTEIPRKEAPKKEEAKPVLKDAPKKEARPEPKEEAEQPPHEELKGDQPDLLKRQMERGVHKDELRKKEHEKKEKPHQHGEYDKR